MQSALWFYGAGDRIAVLNYCKYFQVLQNQELCDIKMIALSLSKIEQNFLL